MPNLGREKRVEERQCTFQAVLGRAVRELTPRKEVGCKNLSRKVSLPAFSHKSVLCPFRRPGNMGLLCLQRSISIIALHQGVQETLTKAKDEL